jgi:glycosyltransferase involved in cell wall biosynthesis
MEPEIRIAYLVSQYPAISHTFILREVLALRKLGIDIVVASINSVDRSAEQLTKEERSEVARTFYVKKTSIFRVALELVHTFLRYPIRYMQSLVFALRLGQPDLKRMLFGLLYFVEAVLLARWMRKSQTTHLHIHFATPASTVGLIASHLTNASLSITVHGPDEFYDVTQYQLLKKIEGCLFLCTISRFASSQLMKLSPVKEWDKFEVTPLGIDPEKFPPKSRNAENGKFEILCVGRLVPAKGQHILIRALESVVKHGGDVRLRFVGDGPDRRSLEDFAERAGVAARVFFEGSVNQDRICQFYNQADMFVLPSFAEGVPVVLMEAMSMELPCVTTRITGISELIRDGIDGLLVAPSDHEELSRTIERLMAEPKLRRDIGEAGRKRVMSCYDLDTNTSRLAEVFRRRLGKA